MNGGAMIIKLQRHADDIITGLRDKAGNHGRIDAAGHRNDDTLLVARSWKFKINRHVWHRDNRLKPAQIGCARLKRRISSILQHETDNIVNHLRLARFTHFPR